MKTLHLNDLPQTNDDLIGAYGELLQTIFGYDLIVLRNYETAEKNGLFQNNLLNDMIEDGLLDIANFTPSATGGIEVTIELTALGFVTKAMAIQNKILAGAAYYRRDVDQSDQASLSPTIDQPIELDPPALHAPLPEPLPPAPIAALAPIPPLPRVETIPQPAPITTPVPQVSAPFGYASGEEDDDKKYPALNLSDEVTSAVGREDDAFAPRTQQIPTDYQAENEPLTTVPGDNTDKAKEESGRTGHAFLVAQSDGNNEANQVDNAISGLGNSEEEEEGFQVPNFLRRTREDGAE